MSTPTTPVLSLEQRKDLVPLVQILAAHRAHLDSDLAYIEVGAVRALFRTLVGLGIVKTTEAKP